MKEITEGIHTWSVYSDSKKIDFNGHYLSDGTTALLIDPPALSDADAAAIESLGRPSRILLTNKDHRREAPAAAARFDAPIWIHEADGSLIDCEVTGTFTDAETISFLQVIHVPGSKSPGECALFWADRGILVLGDALISRTPGQLQLLPDEKFADPDAARAGLSVFAQLAPNRILVGDGHSLHEDATAALAAALEAIAG